MCILKVDPRFLFDFWKCIQTFHMSYENAPWFDECDRTHVPLLVSSHGQDHMILMENPVLSSENPLMIWDHQFEVTFRPQRLHLEEAKAPIPWTAHAYDCSLFCSILWIMSSDKNPLWFSSIMRKTHVWMKKWFFKSSKPIKKVLFFIDSLVSTSPHWILQIHRGKEVPKL